MVKKIAFVMISVALVLTMALSASAAPVFSTGELPLPLVNPVTQWFETNEPVHFGNMSAAANSEGVYVTPSLIANNFSDVYMGEDAFNDDGYVSAGYYSGNYVTISSSNSNGWTNGTNFQGGVNLYATCSEVRTMQPGAVIEFYVHVGNVQLKKLSGDIVSFNRITGIRLGVGVSSSGDGFTPVSAGSIEYEIISYQDKNLYADSQQNLRRLVQKVKITNVSTQGVYFSGIQLIFGVSTENGLGMADPNIIPYGYNQYRFELSVSPVLTYNVTSRDQSYLENMGDTLGSVSGKFDDVLNTLDRDETYDEYKPTLDDVDQKDQLDQMESDAVDDFQNVVYRAQGIISGADMSNANIWWQVLYSKIFNFGIIPIMIVLWSGFIVMKALLGR